MELDLLHEALGATTTAADQPTVAVIVGPAGVGKTSLVARFIDRWRDEYEQIRWVRSSAMTALPESGVQRPSSFDRKASLLVIDDVPDYHTVANALPKVDATHVILVSRNPDWGTPFSVVILGDLDRTSSVELLLKSVPNIGIHTANEIAYLLRGHPAALMQAVRYIVQRAEGEQFLNDLWAFTEVSDQAIRTGEGFYYLDTDDPRAISEFERALTDLARYEGRELELLSQERGSWKRWFRSRYSPDRIDQIADKVERAAEVTALAKPEGEANRNHAEAIARLLESSAAIPNMVVASGSILLIKVTDGNGARVVCKTLNATQLRRIEEEPGILSHPAQALTLLHLLQTGSNDSPIPSSPDKALFRSDYLPQDSDQSSQPAPAPLQAVPGSALPLTVSEPDFAAKPA